MATYSKVLLSGGAATGGWLTITDTATLGETVHTGHATATDEVWLWAQNVGNDTETLTIEWGSASDPMKFRIPPQEPPIQLSAGLLITNDVLSAFASTASVIILHGFVNRIT